MAQSPKATKRKPRSRFSDEYELMLMRLVSARKASGFTQEQVAERLGKVQSHVSLIETREREISVIDLFRWCEAIGVKFSDFAAQFESDVQENRRAHASRNKQEDKKGVAK